MTSSPSFRRELPTSRVAGENLHGLEFPSARRYSVLHAKPSDFTDAGMHEAICYPRPVSLLSASGQYNMLGEPINFSFAFILYLAKGEFPLTCVKILHYEQIIVTMCREALESTGYMIKYDSVNKATFNIKRKFD